MAQFCLHFCLAATGYVLQQVFTKGYILCLQKVSGRKRSGFFFSLLAICVILVENTLAASRNSAGTNKHTTESRQRHLNSLTEGLFITCVYHMLLKRISQLSFGWHEQWGTEKHSVTDKTTKKYGHSSKLNRSNYIYCKHSLFQTPLTDLYSICVLEESFFALFLSRRMRLTWLKWSP